MQATSTLVPEVFLDFSLREGAAKWRERKSCFLSHSFNPFLHQPLIPPLDQQIVATLQIFTLVKLIDFALLGTR